MAAPGLPEHDKRDARVARVAARALGVYDRAAPADAARVVAACLDPRVPRALRAWCDAFAPGDPAALARRLAWDGLDVTTALCALKPPDDWPGTATLPAWTTWLVRFERAARDHDALATESSADARAARDLGVPFGELLAPLLHAARRELEIRLATAGDVFAASARARFDEQLLRELGFVTGATLLESFRARQASRAASSRPERDAGNTGVTGAAGYRRFVSWLLGEGLWPVWDAYPALAEQVALVTESWVAGVTELAARLANDRAAIVSTFFSADPGPVISVAPGLSDPHHGRRRVVVLEFAAGERLVYKPRSLNADARCQHVLAWLAAKGVDAPPVLRVLPRGGYGWMEYAAQQPCRDASEAQRYFRRAGALVCITHLLRAADLHMENVVATRQGPVVVDLEMLLQPVTQAALDLELLQLSDESGIEASCVATGLLSTVQTGADGLPHEAGGLRGRVLALGTSIRTWQHLGTDAVCQVEAPAASSRAANVVTVNGLEARVEDHGRELAAGFTDAYRAVLEHRQEFGGPGGPLAAFASSATRVLARPTDQYAQLLQVLAAPRYQGDGALRSCAVDVLHRAFSRSAERPAVWPLAQAERRALARLDVPHFTVPCGDTVVLADGEPVVEGYFARSGLDAARDRLARLSDGDLARQLRWLRRSLEQHVATRYDQPPRLTEPIASPANFVAAARWIAEALEAAGAVPPGRGNAAGQAAPIDGADLYDGALGAGLFFAALAAADDRERWTFVAEQLLERAVVSSAPGGGYLLGAASGLGGQAYGLALAGVLLGQARWIESAAELADAIAARDIERDEHLDVTSGAAGALLALTALDGLLPREAWRDAAGRCAAHLLARAEPVGEGRAWRSMDGRCYTGFAHGSAGIAYALLAWHRVSADASLLDAIRRARFFEDAAFARGNWTITGPDPRGGTGSTLSRSAWCHGAPGILLSRAAAARATGGGVLDAAAEAALRTLAAAPPHRTEHLCCGNLGRADALFTVGRWLGRPEVAAAGRAVAVGAIERAAGAGHFRLTASPYEYRVIDAALFRGMAGIGYALLRLAAPARLPSVLAVEPFSPGVDR
jgi:type 2 lantibiotic biosynthesis protein LanM